MSVCGPMACTHCYGTGTNQLGQICHCRLWITPHYPPTQTAPNWDNKTRIFDPLKEIQELKERIKQLEDWKNNVQTQS